MTRAGEWKDFALLLTGQSVSQVGSSMTSFGLVLWAYSSTGQVMASSLLAVCSTVPLSGGEPVWRSRGGSGG